MVMTLWIANQMIGLHTVLAANAGQLTDAAARVASMDQGGSPITYIMTQIFANTNVLGLAVIGGFYLLCVAMTIIWSKKQYKLMEEEMSE